MENDFAEISILLGARNCGKTLSVVGSKHSSRPQDKELKIDGLIDIYTSKQMKVLFIMNMNHPAYQHIPVIPFDMYKELLPKWNTPTAYRIICEPEEVNELLLFISTLDNMVNLCLILEDTFKYCENTIPKGISRLAIDSKNKNIWIYMMFHSWRMIPSRMYGLIDKIYLYFIQEHPEYRKDEMVGYYEHALQVYNEILKAAKFSCLTITTGNNG